MLVIVNVHVPLVPAVTAPGGPVFTMARSAWRPTVVVTLAATAEAWSDEPVAVFVSELPVNVEATSTTTVTVTVLPAVTRPRRQVSVAPAVEHVPTVVVGDPWNVVDAGIVSTIRAFVVSEGPLSAKVNVYVSGRPATTGLGVAVFVTAIATTALTSVAVDAELLEALASADVDATVAVLASVEPSAAPEATAPVTVIVADAPGGSVPTEQLAAAAVEHVPTVDTADVHVTPAGAASLAVTPVAVDGPLLVTTSVHVALWPAVIGLVVAALVIDTSDDTATVPDALAVLFDDVGSVVVDETVAALVTVLPEARAGPTAVTRVTVALAPDARVPIVQLTVAPPVHDPTVDVAET